MILAALALAASPFTCVPVSVYDGDTFTCSSGIKVRLRAIDAPEMRKCPRNRVCAPGDPKASRAALVSLVAGQRLSCRKEGRSWDRVTAWCSAGGADLSCSMYRGGYAIHDVEYDRQRRLCR